MNVTLALDADQIGQSTITLTAAQLASIAAQESAPQPPQPPTGPVPPFVAPPAVAARALMKTEVQWSKTGGRFESASPLTDANAWCMGFTPTDSSVASISTAEYQGPWVMRNWALLRNVDGAVIAQSTHPTQTPGVPFNGTSTPITHRIPLAIGTRYTFTVWNATPNESSRMAGQLYM